MPFNIEPYNRKKVVEYAHKWAYSRNPAYYNFDNVGGDCTNFISQCVYAGNGVMNHTKDTGWYFISANNRSAAWSSVIYFHKFITQNKGVGPFGKSVDIDKIEPGDIIQLRIHQDRFHHSLVVVGVIGPPTPDSIFIATHYYDSDYRPLSDYDYKEVRFIHIEGVRRYS